MKRGLLVILGILAVFLSIQVVTAACNLDVEIINQDPYPAIPGDYVDVVFQLTGVGNPECGTVTFEVLEEFPFSLDPSVEASKNLQSGTYTRRFESFAILPYEIRVNEEALDGANPIEVAFKGSTTKTEIKEFNIEIDDVRTDFEVSINDYIASERKITFEILNIGENDVEALTIEIPQQENIEVKGSNREIVGDLDSNEESTFSYEATPKDGEITLTILYTDTINERRTIEKTVTYDSSYFTGRLRDEPEPPTTLYTIIVVVVLIVIWLVYRSIKKRRKEKLRQQKFESHRHKKK